MFRMEEIKIVSKVISSAIYEKEKFLLRIKFNNQKEYVYYNVPMDLWEHFKKSESKGKFYNQFIKNKFKLSII